MDFPYNTAWILSVQIASSKQTGNLRAAQVLFGHTEIESTVRYKGIDIEDALILSESTEI